MHQHLSLITLGVSNLEASRGFYSRGLGWKPLMDVDSVVFYQVGGGVVIGLWNIDEMSEDTGHTAVPGSAIMLSHNVASETEVDAVMQLAVDAGATVLKAAKRATFGGYHGVFADPDGHRWEVAHNPGWSVAADGTVTLKAVQ